MRDRVYLKSANSIPVTAYFTIGMGLTVFILFAGLIPLGHWADEYYTLRILHDHGFGSTLARLWYWSPRPLAEILNYLYSKAVYQLSTPLIASSLAPFWILLLLAVLLPTWRNSSALLAASVLLAMMLLGHPISDAFYWPIAAFAYIPTVAAAAAILAMDWGDWTKRDAGRIWVAAALLMAAISSEVGALFCTIYATLTIALEWRKNIRNALLFTPPLLVALVILYFQFTGRVEQSSKPYSRELFGPSLISHHPLAVIATLRDTLFFQLFKGDSSLSDNLSLMSGIATKLLFFVGIYLAISSRDAEPNTDHSKQVMRLVLVIASLLTAALTLAAAFYNFGTNCCERHDTMRQVYVFVALGSFASYLAAYRPAKASVLAAPVLFLALLVPLWSDTPKLIHDYRDYSNFLLARRLTWQSGRLPGPTMQITQTNPGEIVGGFLLPPQIYYFRTRNNLANGMLGFYGKESASAGPPIDAPKP